MANRDSILDFLGETLQPESFKDYAPNGLQLEGSKKVNLLVGATSASLPVIEKCVELNADMLLVHHGWFWPSDPKPITGPWKKKLKMAMGIDLNLVAYHLPLDCHESLGNNVPVLKELNLADIVPIDAPLFGGEFTDPESLDAFSNRLKSYFKQCNLIQCPSDKLIRKVAICSGAGQTYFRKAIEWGADFFITGEGTEWVYSMAIEHNCHYAAVGHNTGERVGVQLLGNQLAKEFSLEFTFVTEDNPF